MKIDKNIIGKLPGNLKFYKGFVIGGKIYLRSDIYDDLNSAEPKPESIGVYIHEQTHLDRLKSKNWVIAALKYWLLPNIRYQEEIEANMKQFDYLKKNGGSFNFGKRAQQLSGWQYLFCISYNQALKDLKEIWDKV